MTIWFTGCTHFGHDRIRELCNRPFGSVEEMDEVMIENHNSLVKTSDTVYHLGDFCWHGKEKEYLYRLNGKFEFILGNHDNITTFTNNLASNPQLRVMQVHKYLIRMIYGKPFVLFHYPIEDWDMRYKGSMHLHAHTHDKEFRRPSIPSERTTALDPTLKPLNFPADVLCNRFHVGVDATDYSPVSIDEILSESRVS